MINDTDKSSAGKLPKNLQKSVEGFYHMAISKALGIKFEGLDSLFLG